MSNKITNKNTITKYNLTKVLTVFVIKTKQKPREVNL